MHPFPLNQIQVAPGVIDLGIGQPGFDLLPLAELRTAAAARLAAEDTTLLNYGYGMGDGRFRQTLADFLSRHYHTPVPPQTIFATAGASQALDLLCTHYTRPGDTIFVEDPSYFLALRIFADRRLNVVGIATDDGGLVPAALKDALRQHQPAFLYTIPTFQNPTGVTLTAERRADIVALAEAHNFLIVADEVYHLLGYTETPPLPLAAHWQSERVISVGSFSKILAPGLRLGWLQAAPSRLQPLADSGLVDSGGGLNHFTSALVTAVLASGAQDAYLQRLRNTYGRRVQVMGAALAEHAGAFMRFGWPGGGFFFWGELPEGVDTAVLHQQAAAFQVGFQPGYKFSGNNGRRFLRLSFAFYDETDIEEGVARLGRLLETAVAA